jgi:hypothetical protein
MSGRDENLDDDSWERREVFAYFGSAMYMASVLEVGLSHVLMHGQFMKQVRDNYIATRGKCFDRKKYEDDFDAFMRNKFAQTMGNLIKRVEEFAGFDDDLKARIVAAKQRRDFLTHHYWRETSVKFYTSAGRAEMVEELNADTEMFRKLDRDIEAATKHIRESIGMDDKVVEAYVNRQMERIKAGLSWDDESA